MANTAWDLVIIDDHVFGDLKSFREQYTNLTQEQVFRSLKARLKPICHRTLRRQVTAYIPYTNRLPILEEFTPEASEDRLYELVSEYLRRPNLQALPSSQRSLMTLVLRKLLASSNFAIAGALTSISNRLEAKPERAEPIESLEEELDQDYEALDETAEEWDDEPTAPFSETDRAAIEAEIADLDNFARLATSIEHQRQGKGPAQSARYRHDQSNRELLRVGPAQCRRRNAEPYHLLRARVRAAFFAEADRFAKGRRADALPPNFPPFK